MRVTFLKILFLLLSILNLVIAELKIILSSGEVFETEKFVVIDTENPLASYISGDLFSVELNSIPEDNFFNATEAIVLISFKDPSDLYDVTSLLSSLGVVVGIIATQNHFLISPSITADFFHTVKIPLIAIDWNLYEQLKYKKLTNAIAAIKSPAKQPAIPNVFIILKGDPIADKETISEFKQLIENYSFTNLIIEFKYANYTGISTENSSNCVKIFDISLCSPQKLSLSYANFLLSLCTYSSTNPVLLPLLTSISQSFSLCSPNFASSCILPFFPYFPFSNLSFSASFLLPSVFTVSPCYVINGFPLYTPSVLLSFLSSSPLFLSPKPSPRLLDSGECSPGCSYTSMNYGICPDDCSDYCMNYCINHTCADTCLNGKCYPGCPHLCCSSRSYHGEGDDNKKQVIILVVAVAGSAIL
jgi:hypothetical protein